MSSLTEDKIVQYFEAVESNDTDKVEELLSSGDAQVDLRNPELKNRTALHMAGQYGHCALARLLVDEYHATVNIQDDDGDIPLQVATDYYHMNIVKFLLERNSNLREYAEYRLNSAEIDELFDAAESNKIEKVRELVTEQGVDVNSEDNSNWHRTILEVAATNGYLDLIRVLVEELGANIQHEDELGESALHMTNDKNIVNYLLERGFVNQSLVEGSDDESDSSLHFPE